MRGWKRYHKDFEKDPESARRLIRHGESAADARLKQIDLAAYLSTAAVILNLDETITKE